MVLIVHPLRHRQAGSTALIVASSGGNTEVVLALLAAGADKEAINQVGDDEAGHIRVLLKKGVMAVHDC